MQKYQFKFIELILFISTHSMKLYLSEGVQSHLPQVILQNMTLLGNGDVDLQL